LTVKNSDNGICCKLNDTTTKKHTPALQQKYWIGRSKLLTVAREKQTTMLMQQKMSTMSSVFLLDVRFLFNKAQQQMKFGNQKVRHLLGKLVDWAKAKFEAIPSAAAPNECDITAALNCIRSHSFSSEPYWEQAYKLLPSDLTIPIGQARLFVPLSKNARKSTADNFCTMSDPISNVTEHTS
jgi:hypothetical protein